MGHTGDSAGATHRLQKFLLIRARILTRQLNFDIQGLTVTNTVAENISLAVMADVYDRAVLGVELAYRVVSSDAAVLTQGYDDLILQYGFGVNNRPPPNVRWRSVVALKFWQPI